MLSQQLPPEKQQTELRQLTYHETDLYSEAQKSVEQTIDNITKQRKEDLKELTNLLLDLNKKLDSYPDKITVPLKETQKLCSENEKKIDDFILLKNKRLNKLQKKCDKIITSKKTQKNQNLDFQKRILTLLEEQQSFFFKGLGAGATLVLLFWLWNYTHK